MVFDKDLLVVMLEFDEFKQVIIYEFGKLNIYVLLTNLNIVDI